MIETLRMIHPGAKFTLICVEREDVKKMRQKKIQKEIRWKAPQIC